MKTMTRYIKIVVWLMCTLFGVAVDSYGQTAVSLKRVPSTKAAPGQPTVMPNGNGSITDLQATHSLRQTIYIAPTSTARRRLLPQVNQSAKFTQYVRWYPFDQNVALPTFSFTVGTAFANTANGTYINGGLSSSANTRPEITSAFIGRTVAVDLSKTAGVIANNILTEPQLDYRMIFDIRSAKEISDPLMASTIDTPLESHDMIAPIGRPMLIGPSYAYTTIEQSFNNNTNIVPRQSNYYVYNTATSSYVETRSANSGGINDFYWYCPETNTTIIATSNSMPGTNGNITPNTIFNGQILSLAAYTGSATVRNWYLRNSKGNCIVRFTLNYQSTDVYGPKKGGFPEYTPEKLSSSLKPLTERNFDYEINPGNAGSKIFKGYGLRWDECTYGFYNQDGINPEWSQYAFITTPPSVMGGWCYRPAYDRLYQRTNGEKMGMMYYVAASEVQGILSKLDISEACCPGTKIYISSWVRNLNNQGALGPNLNFEIIGFNADTNKDEVLRGFATGTMDVDATNGNSWYQVFFPVVVPHKNYTKLYFQIVNNQLGSSGNDYALDDIQVFVGQPTATAQRRSPMCGRQAVVNISLDYARLADIVALNSSGYTTQAVGYCIADKQIYDNYLAGYDKKGNAVPVASRTAANALNESRVMIYSGADVNGSSYYNYFVFRYNRDAAASSGTGGYLNIYQLEPDSTMYKDIDSYNTYYTQEMQKQRSKIFRKNTVNPTLSFQVTLQGTADVPIATGRDYYIIFNKEANLISEATYNGTGSLLSTSDINTLTSSAGYNITEQCAMFTEIKLRGTAAVEMNGLGTLYEAGTDVCANTRPTFAINTLAYMEDGVRKTVGASQMGVVFDWYKGTIADLEKKIYSPNGNSYQVVAENSSGAFSVADALKQLRSFYTSAGSIESFPATGTYTASMRALLIALCNDNPSANFSNDHTLSLYSQSYSPNIGTDAGVFYYYVAIPFKGALVADSDILKLICMQPQQIMVRSASKAPSLQLGIDGADYGNQSVIPIRVGLSQIRDIRANLVASDQTVNFKYLRLPIFTNKISFSKSTFNNIKNVAATSSHYRKVILIDSTDPIVVNLADNNIVVGYISWMDIKKANAANSNSLGIYFFADANGVPPVTFREGYTYNLKFFISEYDDANNTGDCEGSVLIPMKIVPEYQVWNGSDAQRNYNNDANWLRAEGSQFFAASTYTGNNRNYRQSDVAQGDGTFSETPRTSFVPIYNTKIIMPAGKTPRLAQITQANRLTLPNLTVDNALIGNATPLIQNDLNIYPRETDSNGVQYYPCLAFYANRCDTIYFQPGGAMMNTHYLTYNQAVVDFAVKTNRWYLLGAPLTGVVAGDMYTLTAGGIQNTYAFKGVNYSTSLNHRFKPAVYQRAWDKLYAYAYEFNNQSSSAAAQTKRNLAMRATWSTVFNDVNVPYAPGTGFSIKSQPEPTASYTENRFRLPKIDQTYSYFTYDGLTDTGDDTSVTVNRNKPGRLASDGLTASTNLVVNLSATNSTTNINGNSYGNNKLYLLANPFMCNLDMRAFLTAHSTIFESQYWLLTADRQTGVIMGDGTVTVSSSGTAPTIGPMQGFFVQLKSGVAANPTVTYTTAMMTDGAAPVALTRGTTENDDTAKQLIIEAQREGVICTALIRQLEEEDGSGQQLDLPTLLDDNLEQLPMIYTIKGDQAMQIHTLAGATTIPIGIYSSNHEEVEVSFRGTHLFDGLTLYDALTDNFTPLDSDMTLLLPGNTNGRYQLVFSTGIEEEVDLAQSITVSAIERERILVTSDINDPIKEIIVHDTAGRLMTHHTEVNTGSHNISVAAGTYIVTVKTASARFKSKVLVRR